jgi:hypothetical protein
MKPRMDKFMQEHLRQGSRIAMMTWKEAYSPIRVTAGGDDLSFWDIPTRPHGDTE